MEVRVDVLTVVTMGMESRAGRYNLTNVSEEHTSYFLLVFACSIFESKDGGGMFLHEFGELLRDYKALHSRR
jgi:hypothetical protein